MVLDSRGMIQHYRRIYNAKPSPEIAKTRTSSSNRRRPATAGASSSRLSRRSTSFQSLNESAWISDWTNGWGIAEWAGSVNDQAWQNVSRVPSVQKQQDLSRRRPYSAHTAATLKPKVSNFDASLSGKKGMLQKSMRPSSAVATSQMKQDPRQRRTRRLRPSSTAEIFRSANNDERIRSDEKDNFLSYRDMKRFNSMHDLNNFDTRGVFSTEEVGLRRTTSLSERIDTFLESVHREEEQLQHLLAQRQHQAQLFSSRGGGSRNTRNSSVRPSMSSVVSAGNVSSRKTSTVMSVSSFPSRHRLQMQRLRQTQEVQNHHKSQPAEVRPVVKMRRPLAKQQSFNNQKKPNPAPVVPDTSHVVSKLKQDRNYQPPRQKKPASADIQMQQRRQQSSSDNGDYEDDFEAGEDEEEDTDTAMMKKKQAWLYDQFRRVRARQSAALIVKRQESGAEKASSKDSAYGYSGGETSRMHTREPTPDYHQGVFQRQVPSHRLGIKQRIVPSQRTNHHSTSMLRNQAPLVPKHLPDTSSREQSGIELNEFYVKFLSIVTNDILKGANFSSAAIKRIIEQNLGNSKVTRNLSKREIDELVVTLRQELGLEPANPRSSSNISQGIRNILQIPTRTSKPRPGHVISRPKQHQKNVISQNRMPKHQQPPHQSIEINISNEDEDVKDDDDCDEMFRLLSNETDLDDSIIDEIIRAATDRQQPKQKKMDVKKVYSDQTSNVSGLFKSLNISNLDVSFNGASAKRRDELNESKALLIKSFALQGKERSIKTKNEEKAKEEQLGAASKAKQKTNDGDENETPRSSMLYQTDDEDDVSEDIEEDGETLGEDESVQEDI